MGKKDKAIAINPQSLYGYGGQQAVEHYRPMTPEEVLDNTYNAVIKTSGLNAVTHLALESAASVAMHKMRLLSEFPGIEAELNAIAFNHVQSLLQIQRSVAESMYREQ